MGSRYPDNSDAELFEFAADNWQVVASYPYVSGGQYDPNYWGSVTVDTWYPGTISRYEMMYIADLSAYIVIGGYTCSSGWGTDCDVKYLAKIAMFRCRNPCPEYGGEWIDKGELKTARWVRLISVFALTG